MVKKVEENRLNRKISVNPKRGYFGKGRGNVLIANNILFSQCRKKGALKAFYFYLHPLEKITDTGEADCGGGFEEFHLLRRDYSPQSNYPGVELGNFFQNFHPQPLPSFGVENGAKGDKVGIFKLFYLLQCVGGDDNYFTIMMELFHQFGVGGGGEMNPFNKGEKCRYPVPIVENGEGVKLLYSFQKKVNLGGGALFKISVTDKVGRVTGENLGQFFNINWGSWGNKIGEKGALKEPLLVR